MTPYMQYAAIFVDAVDALIDLPTQNGKFILKRKRGRHLTMQQGLLHVVKHPRVPYGGTSYHNTIHAVTAESLNKLLRGGNVAVANHRDGEPGILLYPCNHFPIGLTGVHLRTCASVHSQCLYPAVLQLLGKLHYDLMLMIPPKTCFNCHRQSDCINYGTGYFQHFGNVTKHPGSSSLPCHFLHRASEIDVDYIRTGCFHHPGCFHHRPDFPPVNLYGCRALGRFDVKFPGGRGYIAYQRVSRHELRICHIGAKFLAYKPERLIGNILHRGKHHRALSKVYIGNLHDWFEINISCQL